MVLAYAGTWNIHEEFSLFDIEQNKMEPVITLTGKEITNHVDFFEEFRTLDKTNVNQKALSVSKMLKNQRLSADKKPKASNTENPATSDTENSDVANNTKEGGNK